MRFHPLVIKELIRESLWALLQPVRLKDEGRFYKLLNACDCYPFAVLVCPNQMVITDDRREIESFREEAY